ncbi:protein kinase [Ophiostoma piceae UAMH 11346]|uniref:non-specific serine/threonine protein kinase n=1 Tax=Ophiostoma piceae (strain UAMH 11346) TaxID=1262450 RepID=S3BZ62_OPHP1|nr:protein kinase [Ophiostoma piceae UAMH 11346]
MSQSPQPGTAAAPPPAQARPGPPGWYEIMLPDGTTRWIEDASDVDVQARRQAEAAQRASPAPAADLDGRIKMPYEELQIIITMAATNKSILKGPKEWPVWSAVNKGLFRSLGPDVNIENVDQKFNDATLAKLMYLLTQKIDPELQDGISHLTTPSTLFQHLEQRYGRERRGIDATRAYLHFQWTQDNVEDFIDAYTKVIREYELNISKINGKNKIYHLLCVVGEKRGSAIVADLENRWRLNWDNVREDTVFGYMIDFFKVAYSTPTPRGFVLAFSSPSNLRTSSRNGFRFTTAWPFTAHQNVQAKLGYGGTSTVWLARDLNKERLFRALKVHTRDAPYHHELSVYEHLKKPIQQEIDDKDSHPGRDHVRHIEDCFFKLDGPHGQHAVFVMVPLGISLAGMQARLNPGVFELMLVTQALGQALLGLALLHSADVIHTDLHADNLLIALTDESILSILEESETTKPSPRKQVGDTTIHVSQYILGGAGALTICDLGQARIGRVCTGEAMPTPYRAPEVILNMPWGTSVDMWSVGMLAWTLLEPKSLFHVFDTTSPELNDAHHLAAMTALLGPPPKEFRDRSKESIKYWDEQGNWQGPVPLPPKTPLADLVTTLEGEQKTLFVDFLECVLTWLPEERLTADQTYFHPWLRFDENGVEES